MLQVINAQALASIQKYFGGFYPDGMLKYWAGINLHFHQSLLMNWTDSEIVVLSTGKWRQYWNWSDRTRGMASN